MRFFEIATPQFRVIATKRFMKSAAVYLRGGYGDLAKTFKAFLEFKSQNPHTPFSKKDFPFRVGSKALRSIWHAHLVHGKVIALYQPMDSAIRLYDMVDHDTLDSPQSLEAFADYVEALKSSDFTPVVVAGTESDSVNPTEKRELDELLWEMSVQDRDILVAAQKGDMADLMEFMTLTVDKPAEKLVAAYGGEDGLVAFIGQIFRQMGVA